jgi:hypothetical protein
MIARGWRAFPPVLVAATCLAAAPTARGDDDYVEAVLPSGEVPEEELLDVAIDLFSPSIDDHDREELVKEGSRPSVRKSEARFIPIHLRDTLQSTGQWGVVRVVPGGAPWAEVSVYGRIVKSNGKDLEVEVAAWDAAGNKWLDEAYRHQVGELTYAEEKVDRVDPFQSLYNEIANDLVKSRGRRDREELVRVRDVAELRFASYFAPTAFGPYLASDKKGRYRVLRLPAADDPMLERLSYIRQRDHLFIDTLNEYYTDFHARMGKPYDDWRAYSYAEQAAYDSLQKSSLIKKIIGGVAIAAGILMPDDRNTGIKDVAVIGGLVAIQSGMKDSEDSKIHKAALDELADSFEADVTPLLVDVDGKITQLTGSAEAQFTQWRELLRQIAETDAALPGDINVVPMSTAVMVTPEMPSSTVPDLPAAGERGDEGDPDGGEPADLALPADRDGMSETSPAEPLRNLIPVPARAARPPLRP